MLAARARALYKMGELSYLRLLLSVDRPSDIFRGYRLVTTVARRDNQRIARFRSDLASLAGAPHASWRRRRSRRSRSRPTSTGARRTLDQDRRRKTALLTSIVEKKETHAAFVEELRAGRDQAAARCWPDCATAT